MRILLLLLALCAGALTPGAKAQGQVHERGADRYTNSVVYTNQFVAYAGGGAQVHTVMVQNSSASDVWVQVFDSATNKVAGTDVEIAPTKVPAGITGGYDFTLYSLPLRRGITVQVSTTDRTVTNAAASHKITVIYSK